MNKYYDSLNDEVKEYFSILSPEFPEWLLEYIDTPEMERISKISISCGTDYSKCFNIRYWYSNLDHSVGVALIIWHFTHDKKQTLAGLFHDIATPVFKHCIDFMNGDSETQESTEEKTSDIINNSSKIMSLLYNNIVVTTNEDGIQELAFKDKEVCEEYIDTISKLWPEWVSDKDRTVMKFLADMCKSMNNAGYLTIEDLYTLSEQEVIDKILTCEDKYLSDSFKLFQDADTVYRSAIPADEKYCVNIKAKTRYVVPLVQTDDGVVRINQISETAANQITEYLNCPKGGYYTYFDFQFVPYEEIVTKKLIKKDNV